MLSEFPLPSAEALAVSARLLDQLHQKMDAQGGCISFDQYMEQALYAPGLGYYSNGLMPFGEGGDFITAPESGNLFAQCLARPIADVLRTFSSATVLELGAGSGVLAADLLEELERLEELPDQYWILETSAAMQALQRERLQQQVPGLLSRVSWLTELPAQPLDGVIFGNEVADALPVQRFCWNDGDVTELAVGLKDGALADEARPADKILQQRVALLADDYCWDGEYRSEWCPMLSAWVKSLADCVGNGLLLLIDYGYARAEYYHPQRTTGTLVCHYRHRAHADPYWNPGLQDITAFVDFTSIAEAASDAGLQMQGFTSQGRFLLACGVDQVMAQIDSADTRAMLELGNQLKRLVLQGDMGERFKCIGFSRGLEATVHGFEAQDLRSRL